MSETRALPLFPLNAILFPGQAMSLHIFEERYKLMINRCLEEGAPIGIVLIREGEEVGEAAVPYDIGTVAAITETDRQENGELDIIAVGQERFVIREILQETPYLVGHVEAFLPVEDDAPRAWSLSKRLREMLPAYVEALAQATGTFVQVVNVPDTPVQLAYLGALVLQIRLFERQSLLDTAEVSAMLAQEIVLMARETALWRYVASTQEAQKQREDNEFGSMSVN